jgi:hypothetical protein
MKKLMIFLVALVTLVFADDKCYDFRVCDAEIMEAMPTGIWNDSMLCRHEDGISYKEISVKINGLPVKKTKAYGGIVCRKVTRAEHIGSKVLLEYGFSRIKEDLFSQDQLLELVSGESYGCQERHLFTTGCDEYRAEANGRKFVGKVDDDLNVSGYCTMPNGKKRHVVNLKDCIAL